MSIWCSIEGTVKTHTYSKVSLEKVLNVIFNNDDFRKPTVSSYLINYHYLHDFVIEVCIDGIYPSLKVQELIDYLKVLDKTCKCDIVVTSRFLA